jgi:hypothetical protein
MLEIRLYRVTLIVLQKLYIAKLVFILAVSCAIIVRPRPVSVLCSHIDILIVRISILLST